MFVCICAMFIEFFFRYFGSELKVLFDQYSLQTKFFLSFFFFFRDWCNNYNVAYTMIRCTIFKTPTSRFHFPVWLEVWTLFCISLFSPKSYKNIIKMYGVYTVRGHNRQLFDTLHWCYSNFSLRQFIIHKLPANVNERRINFDSMMSGVRSYSYFSDIFGVIYM